MAPVIAIIKKAIKVRRKMFALAQAKENTMRRLAGWPPRMGWWEACIKGCLTTIKIVVCRAFCPCWLEKYSFKQFFCPRTTCYGRCFYEGDYENEVFKNCLGFIFGSILTMLFYAWLCLQKDYPRFQAAIISVVVGVVLTLGMSFSHTIRCLVFLTLPSMFSKKGRGVLLVYATVLVFSYPAANLSANFKVMADSATCGQSLMLNETRQLIAMAKEPLSAMIDGLKTMYRSIKAFASVLMAAFKALIRAVKEILSAIAAVFKWLYSLVDICNDQMGEPYRKCKQAFDDAYNDCADRLGIFKFLCGIVSAASHLCELARIAELLCAIGGAIKSMVISAVSKATVGSIQDLKDMFWFTIDLERRYNYNMTQSRTYEEVKAAIMKEIKAKLSSYTGVLSVLDNVMMVTVFYVFTKAWSYRRGYLTKDEYDNYYVTEQVHDIDERRRKLRHEYVLPLKPSEQRRYIPVCSYKMTRKELRKLIKGLSLWTVGAYWAAYYLAADYGVYWVLGTVAKHLNVKTVASIPAFLQLHVSGEGSLADMYRTMVNVLDPMAESGLEIDTYPCIPIPHRPDFYAYFIIILLYFIILFLSIFEAYGLRLRRMICACYYPKRERQRAVWLYNTMLFKRGNFFKFARRQIRRKFMNDKSIETMSIRGRIVKQFPKLKPLMECLGYDFKNCLLCGLEGRKADMERFVHCTNYGCTGVYCHQCFGDLNNLCTACMNPVEYGDFSDASEEEDSSEDEEMMAYRKKKARERRAKREEQRRKDKQKPRDILAGLFKGHKVGDILSKQRGGDGAHEPLLDEEAGGATGKSSTGSGTSGTESYDSSYQYRNKADIPTSTADETSASRSPSPFPSRTRSRFSPASKSPRFGSTTTSKSPHFPVPSTTPDTPSPGPSRSTKPRFAPISKASRSPTSESSRSRSACSSKSSRSASSSKSSRSSSYSKSSPSASSSKSSRSATSSKLALSPSSSKSSRSASPASEKRQKENKKKRKGKKAKKAKKAKKGKNRNRNWNRNWSGLQKIWLPKPPPPCYVTLDIFNLELDSDLDSDLGDHHSDLDPDSSEERFSSESHRRVFRLSRPPSPQSMGDRSSLSSYATSEETFEV